MKKGFLSGNSTGKSQSNELIEISTKKSDQTKDFRVFDEVQQVIKEEEQSKSEGDLIRDKTTNFYSHNR
jgi:hypothetical protein